ncbi:MAG: V0D/AC39 family V-type ATPase subunit [Promethearchaeota archaeon]
MKEEELKKLKTIDDIAQFIDYIKPYYPGLEIESFFIEEIERKLQETLIRLIGKMIQSSPQNMAIFLKNYLLKYEIFNLKRILLGTILGMKRDEISPQLNLLVEKFLNHEEFIEELLRKTTLTEVQVFLKNTPYYQAVREGLLYFNKNKEIFVLVCFLDQLYYKNLARKRGVYHKNEQKIIDRYIEVATELYNINIIYRGILNKIDKNLLFQFLVFNFLFLDKNKILNLLKQEDIESFTSILNSYLERVNIQFDLNKLHPMANLIKDYQDYFLSKYRFSSMELDYITAFKIIEIIIKKEREIKFYILPKVIDIIHKKFLNLQKKVKITDIKKFEGLM